MRDVDTRTDLERARKRLADRIGDLTFPMLRIDRLFGQSPGFEKLSRRRQQAIVRELLGVEDQIDRLCHQLTTMAGELGIELSTQ